MKHALEIVAGLFTIAGAGLFVFWFFYPDFFETIWGIHSIAFAMTGLILLLSAEFIAMDDDITEENNKNTNNTKNEQE